MLRLTPLIFLASMLFVGCTAPAHLMNTSELSQDEKMQQTIAVWKGTHISKAVQKWGSPHSITDDGTGSHICIWQVPVQTFLARQEHRILSRRHANGLTGVAGTILQTDYTYEITFYTRPNGIISKTLLKKNYDAASELKWK